MPTDEQFQEKLSQNHHTASTISIQLSINLLEPQTPEKSFTHEEMCRKPCMTSHI